MRGWADRAGRAARRAGECCEWGGGGLRSVLYSSPGSEFVRARIFVLYSSPGSEFVSDDDPLVHCPRCLVAKRADHNKQFEFGLFSCPARVRMSIEDNVVGSNVHRRHDIHDHSHLQKEIMMSPPQIIIMILLRTTACTASVFRGFPNTASY